MPKEAGFEDLEGHPLETELLHVGMRIAAAREHAGLTQVKLGELVGLHSVSVSRIETAKQSVSVGSLIQIARVLHTTAAELLAEPLDSELPARRRRS